MNPSRTRLSLLALCTLVTIGMVGAGLGVAGCAAPEPGNASPAPAVTTSAGLGDGHHFGTPVWAENLTVWPIHTDKPVTTVAFTSLREAQEAGLAEVRERALDGAAGLDGATILDGATVNELEIENRGDEPILVCAGTVVKGGKQDRQTSQDIVIPPGKTIPVDAFCVEHGRWTIQREGRSTDGVFEVAKVLAAKRIRTSAQYANRQQEVWDQVDKVNARAGKAPITSTFLATAEEDDREAVALRERLEESVRRHFEALSDDEPPVVGFAYAVNGEPLTVRTFANHGLFTSHFESFLKTMCLEAQITQLRDRTADREIYDQQASLEPVLEMIEEIGSASLENRVTAGLNRNEYRRNERGGQSSCLVPGDGEEWITVTRDWTAAAELTAEIRSKLEAMQALGYTK